MQLDTAISHFIAHYSQGLRYAQLNGDTALTDTCAREMFVASHQAYHAANTHRLYSAAQIDAVSRPIPPKTHGGLSVFELSRINEAFWGPVCERIGLPFEAIKEDVQRIWLIGQLSSVYGTVRLAQIYETSPGQEQYAPTYIESARQTLKALKATGDDYDKLDTKGLMECVVSAISLEQWQLKMRPRKPALAHEAGHYRIRPAAEANA